MAKTCAVVLAGCGVFDGSEVHEAVSILIHLSRLGVEYQCFAPDAMQAGVVNHATRKPADGPPRSMLEEAARISRGDIRPLSALDASAFDAAAFPGGFGAAMNLCTFATAGAECTVREDVARVVRAFHAAKKPIGMACISPVIAAKVLGTAAGGPGCLVTIGSDKGVADAIAAMGSRNQERSVREACVDEENRVVTTPAYMCDARPHEVFEGIGRMIEAVGKLAHW